MSADSSTALLLRLKWRGFWRKQARRLRTPGGLALALLGAGMFALWLLALVHQLSRPGPRRIGPEDAELIVQLALAGLVVVTFSNAISFRGLYVPASEIETLFAAPLSRAAVIRLRLCVVLARSAFGALLAGLAASRLATSPSYGFAGAFAAMLWIPVLGQGLSILLGDAENRIASRLARLPQRWIRALVLALVLACGALFVANLSDGPRSEAGSPFELLRALAEQPVAAAVLGLFWPWARAIAATGPAEFWPAFGLCVAILLATLAGVASLRVDYRETALATSADLAKRIARVRRGLGVGGVEARRLPLAWRTPWLFGRGPFGAVAFRKTSSILRKARGGLLFGLVVMAVVTLFAQQLVDEASDGWGAALMVAGFGTFHLTLGLRYDFREELDAMAAIRAWPLAPWRIFLATIVPQIALVSALVALGVVVTLLRAGAFDAPALMTPFGIVLVVSAWVAIDNVAFLLAPTRSAPGQDGMLQNAGRSLVLALLRSLTMLAALSAAAAPTWITVQLLDWPLERAWWLGSVCGGLVLLAQVGWLVWFGGVALRRFDVGRTP